MHHYRLQDLGNLPLAQILQAIADIPVSVTSLDLSNNYLNRKPRAELAQVLAALPANVTSLKLSGNNLFKLSGAALAQTFGALVNVTTLDLSSNEFERMNSAQLAIALAALPSSVTSLDLSRNIFHYDKNSSELAQFLSALPASVTSLNLSHNFLGGYTGAKHTGAELAPLFAAIPPHVKIINLAYNQLFNCKSRDRKDSILMALGQNRGRYILNPNGESDLARALIPMTLMSLRHKVPTDVTAYMLSFFPRDPGQAETIMEITKPLVSTKKQIIKILDTKLTLLKKVAHTAIDAYLSKSEKRQHKEEGGKNGFFSSNIVPIDKILIENLRVTLNNQETYSKAMDVLNEFLPNPQHPLVSAIVVRTADLKGFMP